MPALSGPMKLPFAGDDAWGPRGMCAWSTAVLPLTSASAALIAANRRRRRVPATAMASPASPGPSGSLVPGTSLAVDDDLDVDGSEGAAPRSSFGVIRPNDEPPSSSPDRNDEDRSPVASPAAVERAPSPRSGRGRPPRSPARNVGPGTSSGTPRRGDAGMIRRVGLTKSPTAAATPPRPSVVDGPKPATTAEGRRASPLRLPSVAWLNKAVFNVVLDSKSSGRR